VKATNKLINFAKKAARGKTSPINLIKGRVATEQVLKKLMMETVPKLENIPQYYVNISKKIRRRRGDNAPMVFVTIRNSEKEEVVKMQEK
jgi:ribosomal protein L17